MVGKTHGAAIRVCTGFHTALHGRIVAHMATRNLRPESPETGIKTAAKAARTGLRSTAPAAASASGPGVPPELESR